MENFIHILKSLIAFLSFYIVNLFFYKKVESQDRILFIHTAGIGDLIHSTKIINSLENDSTKITFLVKTDHQEFYKYYNGPVDFFIIDYDDYAINVLYRLSTLRKLRSFGFDKVFVLNYHRRIMDDDLALNIGAEKVVALNKVENQFIKIGSNYIDDKYDEILYSTNEYVQNKYDFLISKYFMGKSIKNLSIYLNEEETLKTLFAKIPNVFEQEFITINPVSSTEIRNWKIEKFIEVITNVLKSNSCKILLLGDESQNNYLQKLNIDKERILNLAGKINLLESFLLIKKSRLFIGVDSALAHAAIFFNVSRILLIGGGPFGLNFPIEYYHKKIPSQKLIFKELDCFGCNWHCKFEEPHCLNDISSNKINEKIDLLLSKRVE